MLPTISVLLLHSEIGGWQRARERTHTHTQWPEAYPFNHYVNFKECFRDKSAISLLAHAGRSEEGRENVRRKTYGHLREQRGMTDRGREGGDGALWSPLVTALQERESKARTALLNELMTRTFDVHYNKKKKRKKKNNTPTPFSHTSSAVGRVNHSHGLPQNEKTSERWLKYGGWYRVDSHSNWMTRTILLFIPPDFAPASTTGRLSIFVNQKHKII